MRYLLFILLFSSLIGCSYRGAYESIQLSNQRECYKLPQSQQDECINSTQKSYAEYERERLGG